MADLLARLQPILSRRQEDFVLVSMAAGLTLQRLREMAGLSLSLIHISYLLAAEDDALREKPDENSGVAWFTPEEALAASTEPWMVQRVYRKLADRAAAYMKT